MRDKSMSTGWWAAAACALLAFGTSAAGQQTCSNHVLFGDYGVQIEGTIVGPNWPLRTLAMVRFDGNGGFTYADFVVLNGSPTSPDWTPNKTGTYSVNPDCTASALFDGPIPVHLVVVDNGKDFRGVVDGNAITLVGSRVH